jgi:hypothetical protein
MGEYWRSYQYGSRVRAVFTDAIIKAMKKQGDICVVGHSLYRTTYSGSSRITESIAVNRGTGK